MDYDFWTWALAMLLLDWLLTSIPAVVWQAGESGYSCHLHRSAVDVVVMTAQRHSDTLVVCNSRSVSYRNAVIEIVTIIFIIIIIVVVVSYQFYLPTET